MALPDPLNRHRASKQWIAIIIQWQAKLGPSGSDARNLPRCHTDIDMLAVTPLHESVRFPLLLRPIALFRKFYVGRPSSFRRLVSPPNQTDLFVPHCLSIPSIVHSVNDHGGHGGR